MRRASLIVAYLGSILAATWAVATIGFVPVGFGLMAPAGVYFIGLTLVARDFLQQQIGPRWTYVLIVVGALLSALISPQIALASGLAFLASETVDFIVYTATERFGTLRAVLLSNAASIVVDSVAFLALAFGSLAFLPGQVWGKAVATLVAVAVLALIRLRKPEVAA